MKTRKKTPCRFGGRTANARSRGAQFKDRIRSLIKAACAARAGAAQMNLNDWIDVEQEVKRRLQYEC